MYPRRQQRHARTRPVKSRPRHHFCARKLGIEPLEHRRLLAGIGPLGFQPDNGPQVVGLLITGQESYSLFSPKPSVDGPTPLVHSLTIRVQDLPPRVPALPGDYNDNGIIDAADFVVWRRNLGQSVALPNDLTPGEVNDADYDLWRENFGATASGPAPSPALDVAVAQKPIHYQLVGDFTGSVRIQQVEVELDPIVANQPATASIRLLFDKPMPDDRFTLFVSDAISDPEGNPLDGESNASQPGEPTFPSGDGLPGGDFVARFTIDSRPEIGSRVGTDINIDINGNRLWDPSAGGDPTNVDLIFPLAVENSNGSLATGGFGSHDQLFAGKFIRPNVNPPDRLFDQLAAYGYSPELGSFRWLIDTNGDGVVSLPTDVLATQPALPASAGFDITTAIPIAGDFDAARAGDEIGLYNAGKWAFDTNGDRVITATDLFITGDLFGYPVVGDFDGDSRDDLAVFNSNTWYFDLANDGLGTSDTAAGAATPSGGDADRTLPWGLAGTQDRPLAADMDQDGIDDIGLWLPGSTTAAATWRFLISNDPDPTSGRRVDGNINTLNHAFSLPPTGNDYFAQFGGDRWRPIVGNFDPPLSSGSATASVLAGDYAGDLDAAAEADAGSSSYQQLSGSREQAFTNREPIVLRSTHRFSPARRVQLKPAIADAALADLNLVLNTVTPAPDPVSASPSFDHRENWPDEKPTDGELALQVAWEGIASDAE